MTYEVVMREVPAEIDGRACGFNVYKYYATFYGEEPTVDGSFTDPYVQVWGDGSITAIWDKQKLFLYEDQWLGIIKCVQKAIEDKRLRAKKRQDEWLNETADSTDFCGKPVSLSRRQVLAALNSCPIEVERVDTYTRPIMIYEGKPYGLCRTDLFDDVATSLCADKQPEEWREHYKRLAKTCYGARLSNHDGHMTFAIIDSMTDG